MRGTKPYLVIHNFILLILSHFFISFSFNFDVLNLTLSSSVVPMSSFICHHYCSSLCTSKNALTNNPTTPSLMGFSNFGNITRFRHLGPRCFSKIHRQIHPNEEQVSFYCFWLLLIMVFPELFIGRLAGSSTTIHYPNVDHLGSDVWNFTLLIIRNSLFSIDFEINHNVRLHIDKQCL